MATTTPRKHNVQTPGQNTDPSTIAGVGDDAAVIDIGGKDFLISEVTQGAFETSGLSIEQWRALPADERDARFQQQVLEIADISALAAKNVAVTREPRAKALPKEPMEPIPFGVKPEPHEVDVDQITAPVETTKGWLVPSKPMQIPRA